MNPKQRILELVANGRIKESLILFMESIADSDNFAKNSVFQLSAQWNRLEDDKNKGIVSVADAQLQANKVTNAIIEFANQCNFEGETSALENAITSLPLSESIELGALQLVNCDRILPLKRFNRAFEEKKIAKNPFQFYFLCACPDEMPSSFSERVIYEIMDKESLELNSSVSYVFQESDDFKRVQIESLPLSDMDAAASKKKLKEYVQKRFKFADTESFDSFIATGIPKILYKYVATIFKIDEENWEADEGEIAEYLQWMVDTFQTAHPDAPTFVFLFVIKLKNLYDENKTTARNKQVISNLKAFCERNDSALFDEIKPVNDTHIEGWLSKLGVENPNDVNNVIKEFVKTLSEKDLLTIEGGRAYHMKDVEKLQEKIVSTFRNRN